jgi:hypothetical protein
MRTDLLANNRIPLTQPYSGAPFSYSGTESVPSIPANVVDWVLVELRTGTASGTMAATRAGFVLNNGSVVDLDGVSPLQFSTLTTDAPYYVVIRHRNHLAAMSVTNPLIQNTGGLYDFSAAGQSYGTNGMKNLSGSGIYGIYAGDANATGTVTVSDITTVIPQLNLAGYYSSDVNMSGVVTVSDINMIIPNLNISTQVPN